MSATAIIFSSGGGNSLRSTSGGNHSSDIDRLAQIVSKPAYFTDLSSKIQYAVAKERTAWHFAERSVNYALGSTTAPKLLAPITIAELTPRDYPIHLYRVFDGVDRAMTLGSWWGDRKLVKQSLQAATGVSNVVDRPLMMRTMLNAMFVHPNWNGGKAIARMTIPVGATTPAIVALGDWRALRASASDIDTEADLKAKLGLDAHPGAKQYFLPLYKDMWVSKVPEGPDWPFGAM